MINAGYPITFYYMVVQVYIIVISVQTESESKPNPSFNITNLSKLDPLHVILNLPGSVNIH
jgi:hypothetical protein